MDMENAAQQHKTRQGLLRVTSVAAVPLILEDKSSGVILLEHFNDHHRGFNKADIAQLSEIGKWIPLIIEYHRSELELKETKLSYRQLVGRFLETGEDERRRIAREIHDDINHVLLSVKLDLEDMARSVPEEMEKVREKLKTLHGHVSQAFDNLHRLSLNLRPQILDELGLPQALDLYVRNLSEESGLPITIEVKGLSRRRPAPVVEIELFRIAQEGLSNILKHAHASLAHIRLSFGTLNLMLEIEDDGIGFDVDAIFKDHVSTKNLGLLGMKERAEISGGKLSIFSSQGHGTKLVTTIPIASYNWGTY
jgi:signal transduction histidine kinase